MAKTVPSCPTTRQAPPNRMTAIPHQLPLKGMRSSRSFCCHMRNAATGGISTPKLSSGEAAQKGKYAQAGDNARRAYECPRRPPYRRGNWAVSRVSGHIVCFLWFIAQRFPRPLLDTDNVLQKGDIRG